jgi:uncharacterized protein (DUF58 family)
VLTRQGWLVGIGAAVLLVAGRVLGLFEVFALGVVATTLLIGSAVLVRTARLQLEVGRVVQPARVHVGQRSRVDLAVRNRRPRKTPVLRLRDPVSGTRGADLLVPPLSPAERSVAAYRLPTERRGLVQIGPLQVVVSDPFGLFDVATVAAPEVQLTVLPHVDVVPPLPYTTAHDPQAGIRQLNSLGRTGEEFYALRPFTVGDDLRRVHWPSSARLDELMVRQNELPWQGRTTVLLDVRDAAHSGDSLEVAVSAAASVVAAVARRQDLVRLVTTAGSDSEYAPGAEHVHAILEHLAVVGTDGDANLHRTLDLLGRRSNGGGALVAVVAEVPAEDLRALQLLRARFGSVTVVQVDRSAWDTAVRASPAPDASAVRITRDAPFKVAWEQHVRMLADGRTRLGVGR